jgi:hypothetical protein
MAEPYPIDAEQFFDITQEYADIEFTLLERRLGLTVIAQALDYSAIRRDVVEGSSDAERQQYLKHSKGG